MPAAQKAVHPDALSATRIKNAIARSRADLECSLSARITEANRSQRIYEKVIDPVTGRETEEIRTRTDPKTGKTRKVFTTQSIREHLTIGIIGFITEPATGRTLYVCTDARLPQERANLFRRVRALGAIESVDGIDRFASDADLVIELLAQFD